MVDHAVGNLLGGAIVDVMRFAIDRALAAFSTLFGMEAVMLLIALYLSTWLDVNASQASLEEREIGSLAASAD